MKFDLTLGLADRPGQLVKALEPIAKNGGNIISIVHDREKNAGAYVPVELVVNFLTKKDFEKAKHELENLDVSIIKSEEVIEKLNITCVFIGKLNVRKIFEMEGVRISNFEAFAPTSKEACVKLNIEAPVEDAYKIMEKLKNIADKEKAVLISSV